MHYLLPESAIRHTQDEGRSILSEVYKTFMEGSETSDLKEAKALLDELDFVTNS